MPHLLAPHSLEMYPVLLVSSFFGTKHGKMLVPLSLYMRGVCRVPVFGGKIGLVCWIQWSARHVSLCWKQTVVASHGLVI